MMHLVAFLLVIWIFAAILPGLMGCIGRVLQIMAALALLGWLTHGMH